MSRPSAQPEARARAAARPASTRIARDGLQERRPGGCGPLRRTWPRPRHGGQRATSRSPRSSRLTATSAWSGPRRRRRSARAPRSSGSAAARCAAVAEHGPEHVAAAGDVAVLGPQVALAQGQAPPGGGLGFGEPALALEGHGQVLQDAPRRPPDRGAPPSRRGQDLPADGCGLAVRPRSISSKAQLARVTAWRASSPPPALQLGGAPVEGLGRLVAAEVVLDQGIVVERDGDLLVVLGVQPAGDRRAPPGRPARLRRTGRRSPAPGRAPARPGRGPGGRPPRRRSTATLFSSTSTARS